MKDVFLKILNIIWKIAVFILLFFTMCIFRYCLDELKLHTQYYHLERQREDNKDKYFGITEKMYNQKYLDSLINERR